MTNKVDCRGDLLEIVRVRAVCGLRGLVCGYALGRAVVYGLVLGIVIAVHVHAVLVRGACKRLKRRHVTLLCVLVSRARRA
jgi:hypothetical protein